ncbi:prephenate dehydratase [Desulfohalotomaculum tongense]|uniref:prephenate dehydratase n=1 Tax=Desulforadius tongensis TaxID=1216062 RepID=UPI00195EF956|nr:prephenate dehydratase [Desulforadius tongensis]MBM7856084.1 prephenate dehydratase [Desulforadius tongensis]
MIKKMGYLGPRGTFCEEAALKFMRGKGWELLPYPSIADIFSAVEGGEVKFGIVPIENSCEGAVNETLDLLAYRYDLKIAGEIVLPVSHSLLARPGVDAGEISCILSHPQALAQCRRYLSGNYSQARLVDVSSTAEAARMAAQSAEPWAAVGPARVSHQYGLTVVAPNINDQPNNETRFVVLSREDSVDTGGCKTSLLVYVPNKPGALFKVLEEFSLKGVNLTKIESRPARTQIGEYLFFIDLDGHRLQFPVKEALEELKTVARIVRVLGSYPADNGKCGKNSCHSPAIDNLRHQIDLIDSQIIELLGRRTRLVERVGCFKRSVHNVRDPERERYILGKIKTLARQKGFSPAVAAEIYEILFNHFVKLQQKKLTELEKT